MATQLIGNYIIERWVPSLLQFPRWFGCHDDPRLLERFPAPPLQDLPPALNPPSTSIIADPSSGFVTGYYGRYFSGYYGHYFGLHNSVPASGMLGFFGNYLGAYFGDYLSGYRGPLIQFSEGDLAYPVSGMVPDRWVLYDPDTTPPVSLLRSLIGVLTTNILKLYTIGQAAYPGLTFYWERSVPEFLWYVETPGIDRLDTLEILGTASQRHPIKPARDESDLQWGGDWFYRAQDGFALVGGIGLQSQSSTGVVEGFEHWQFVSSSSTWDPVSLVFWAHPYSGEWIPWLPAFYREDGFLSLRYDRGNLDLRIHRPELQAYLDRPTFFVNGERRTGYLVNAWTDADEKGLIMGWRRKDGEPVSIFGEALLNFSWFTGQSTEQVRNSISAALRRGLRTSVAPAATGMPVPEGTDHLTIKNLRRKTVYSEKNLTYVAPGVYRSKIQQPEMGQVFVNGRPTPHTIVPSGAVNLILVDALDSTDSSQVDASWLLKIYERVGDQVVFSPNKVIYGDYVVAYSSAGVEVKEGSNESKRRSFRRNDPSLRWARRPPDPAPTFAGIAIFD